MDRRIDNLYILRAIFTMGIVANHMGIDDLLGYGKRIYNIGTTGVAYFFVLSGFLILYCVKPVTLGTYLKKKFIRIFPTLWVYTLGVVVLDVLFCKFAGFGFGWAEVDIGIIIRSLFCVPIVEHSNEVLIPPAWTLSYEVLFYIVGAVLIVAGEKIYFAVLSAWTVLIIIFSLMGSKLFLFNSLILELVLGVITAYLIKRNKISKGNILLVSGGGYSLIYSIKQYDRYCSYRIYQ